MTHTKAIDPKEFDKFHNMTRLETIVLDCKTCEKPTTYIYIGKVGVPWQSRFLYKCMNCQETYVSLRKLR